MINEAKDIRENQSLKAIAIEELRKVHGLGNEVEDSVSSNGFCVKSVTPTKKNSNNFAG